jgi:hypothetical protein
VGGEWHLWAGRTYGTFNVTSSAGFAVDDAVVVKESGTTTVVGVGFVRAVDSGSANELIVDWAYSRDAANPPANGDTIQKFSESTLSSVSGTFLTSPPYHILVSGTSSCVGLDKDTAVAYLAPVALAGADLDFIQTMGAGSAIAGGSLCVSQPQAGATAQLGAVTASLSTTITSAITSAAESWNPFTSTYPVHNQAATFAWKSTRVQSVAGWDSLRIGWTKVSGTNEPWVSVLSSLQGAGLPTYRFVVGDQTREFKSLFHGNIVMWDGDSTYGNLASADLAAERTWTFPDKSGTVAMLDDVAGEVTTSGSWATGELPMTDDTSGDTYIRSGVLLSDGIMSLDPSADRVSELRFFEDSDNGSNYVAVRGMSAAIDYTSNPTLLFDRVAKAAPVASGARGPVIGAVSNGGTFDTGDELCDVTYFETASSGDTVNCIAGSAKKFGTTVPADDTVDLIACSDTVDSGVYFEVACNVE